MDCRETEWQNGKGTQFSVPVQFALDQKAAAVKVRQADLSTGLTETIFTAVEQQPGFPGGNAGLCQIPPYKH
jgi:hypothetical protein